MTTTIYSTMASKVPSIMSSSVASSSIHSVDTAPADINASLGGNPACLSISVNLIHAIDMVSLSSALFNEILLIGYVILSSS